VGPTPPTYRECRGTRDVDDCTYWIDVHNLTGQQVDSEARYAVLG
jgi:hypothetical protein